MSTLHDALAALSAGDAVPDGVYIADYADGGVPAWRVTEREDLVRGGVRLRLEDRGQGQADLWEGYPKCTVVSWPNKTLRTPVVLAGDRPQACDLEQQQRFLALRKGVAA